MIVRQLLAIITLLTIVAPFGAAIGGDAGVSLRVTVENLKNDKGRVVIAVFASADDYLEKPIDEAAVEIRANLTGEAEFRNLPAGTYAIAAYHDKNDNGDLDTFLRIPREDYGFSNDARSPFGPPSFKAAAVEIGGTDDVHITIRSK